MRCQPIQEEASSNRNVSESVKASEGKSVEKIVSGNGVEGSTSGLVEAKSHDVVKTAEGKILLVKCDANALNTVVGEVEGIMESEKPWTIARVREEFPKGTVSDFSKDVLKAELNNPKEWIEYGSRTVEGPEFSECLHMDIKQPR